MYIFQSETKTIGQLFTEAIKTNGMNIETLERQFNVTPGLIQQIMNDEFYTNSVPIIIFKNMVLLLNINKEDVYNAMIPTFRFILSKETEESIKKKDPNYMLWENEESVLKYTDRLREILSEPVYSKFV